MSGSLIVCALPIGNLNDITTNVLDCLANVSVIAAEDTRQIQRLLKQLGIFRDQQLIRMDQYQEKRSFAAFETLISTQDVAAVSDAGSQDYRPWCVAG